MKRTISLVLSAVLAVPLMSTAVVLAIENNGSEPTTKPPAQVEPKSRTRDQPKVALNHTEKPITADELKLLQARIEKQKTVHKIKLTNAEKLKIQNKCKAAQGLVSSVSGRVKGLETSRSQSYDNMVARLTDLSAKLKAKNADTTVLDADIVALQAKVTTFSTDLAAYKVTVGDLADMDCKTDPEGFKAALTAARAAQETVHKDAQAIRTYVKDTIKPVLSSIRAELDKKTEGEQ